MRDPLIDFFRKRVLNRRKRKSRDDCVLALDIGTEFVKALLFRTTDSINKEGACKKTGLVIGAGRERQKTGDMIAGAVADIDGVVETSRKAVREACQDLQVRPRKVVIGVAGEFVKGATVHYTCQRTEPDKEIDLVEMQNIIQKAQWKAFDQVRKELASETCRPETEIKPINALLTEVKIDGYKVTNPVGFSGKEVFLGIFNAYARLVHLQALEKVANKLGLELLSVVAESYALSRSMNFKGDGGGVFMDIGGGTTDIALVKHGKVEGIKSVSVAGKNFTKRIAQVLNVSLDQAEALKVRHIQKQFSPNIQDKISKVLNEDVKIWLEGVELVLEEFQKKEPLSCRVLLCGGGSLLPVIRDVLKEESTQLRWIKKYFKQPFGVRFIQPKDIIGITDMTKTLNGPEVATPMALARLALEINLEEEKPLPPILRRSVRMMR